MTTVARWFDGIPAKDLIPWRVTIADCGDIAPISINDVPDNEKKKLRSTDRVSIFGVALPAGTIHVIVQQLLPSNVALPSTLHFT
ncbi:hypothetical protein BGW42_006103 [Actinomortierella wolfii]|nr:hypothetical protein BGW42_006103 [Actinomortierella wolfii]